MDKRVILLDIITNGLFTRPVVRWDDESCEPYVGSVPIEDKVFEDMKELSDTLRLLADELDKSL